MDYRYNRKLGAIVLILALVLGTLIGFKNGMLSRTPSHGLYYDDTVSVLSDKAKSAIDDFNSKGKGTLLVQTVNGTGNYDCYDYTLDLAEELAYEGKLSSQTGMLLVLDVSGDYSFVYGSDLSNLDLSYRYLLDSYIEPSFAKGQYSQAVISFCDGLDSTLSRVSSSSSSGPSGFAVIMAIVIIIILIAMFSQPSRRTRRTTYRRGPMVPPPPPPRTTRSYGSSYSPPRSSSSGSRYGSTSSYSSGNRSSFSSSNRSSGSSFSGGSRSGFSSGSRSSFSSSSRSSSSSSRSSFGGGSRSSSSSSSRSSSSRSSFSGGSRGGFSGRK